MEDMYHSLEKKKCDQVVGGVITFVVVICVVGYFVYIALR